MSTEAELELHGRTDYTDSAEKPLISVVVPIYNEERNIQPFLSRTIPVLEQLGTYEVIFCLDPSTDQTERVVCQAIQHNPAIGLLVFSRRFGQPAATMAGILNCRGKWCVIIDVDLQDPPELIAKMLDKSREGYDAVTARRTSRQGETFVKRVTAKIGYRVINGISEVSIPEDTGDFRIISRRVIEELRGLNERHGFLRGLVRLVGYPQTEVLYKREMRQIGTGNYNRYLGSLKIGFNGIFGFSTFPLQIMMWTGFVIALMSVLSICIVVGLKIWHGQDYPMGLPTVTVLVLFIGGVQLCAVGVLGEYVGRIYDEVRQRPPFIVEKAINVGVKDARGPRSGTRVETNLE